MEKPQSPQNKETPPLIDFPYEKDLRFLIQKKQEGIDFNNEDDSNLEHLTQQKKIFQKRAEQSEQKEIIFPREELEQIRQVNLWINQILSEVKRKQVENPQKYQNEVYERDVIKSIMNALDKLDLWKCKFSTSNNAKSKDNIQQKETDSIYYMTPSGASIRFKMIMLQKNNIYSHVEGYGINAVKTNFATCIYFNNKQFLGIDGFDQGYSGFLRKGNHLPTVGKNWVKEIFDENFLSLINQHTPIETDYHTKLTILTNKDGIWFPHTENNIHQGSLVNKIFFNHVKNK